MGGQDPVPQGYRWRGRHSPTFCQKQTEDAREIPEADQHQRLEVSVFSCFSPLSAMLNHYHYLIQKPLSQYLIQHDHYHYLIQIDSAGHAEQ